MHETTRAWLRRCWPFIVIAAVATAVRIPNFFLPMNRDSGLFAYCGWRILHGERPYVDFWDNKLPGVYYINAFAERVFGSTYSGIQIFQIFYAVATACLFFIVARRVAARGAAVAAATLFAFYHGCYALAEDGNYTETYLALPVLLAVLLIMKWSKERRGYALPAAAGALGAAAILIKQPGAAVIGAAAVYHLWQKDRKRGLAAIGSVSAGAIAVLLIAILWMWRQGILRDAYEANIIFNRLYFIDSYTYGLPVAQWNLLRGLNMMALPLTGAVFGLWALRRQADSVTAYLPLLASWFVFDLVGLALGGRFTNHYFLAILPSAFLLTAISFDCAAKTKLVLPAAIAAAVLFFGPIWNVTGQASRSSVPIASVAQREYYAIDWVINRRIGENRTLPFEQVADWLTDHTTEDDTIYIWGWETRAAFLSNRRICSRYVYINPLAATGFAREARIAELAVEIRSKGPKYIIDTHPLLPTTTPPLDRPSPIPSTAPFFRLDGYEPILKVVAENYRPVGYVANCPIYQVQD